MKHSYQFLTVLVAVTFIINSINGQIANLNNLNKVNENQQSWFQLMKEIEEISPNSEKALIDALHKIFKLLKSSSFPTAVADLSNEKCVNDSLLYVHTFYSLTGSNASWARQMYESSGDYLPLGFFGGSGNLHSDGLFDECLTIRGPGEADFRGQYCSVFLSLTPVNESEIIPVKEGKGSMVTLFQLINSQFGGVIGSVEPKVANATVVTYAYPSTVFCLPSSCTAGDLGQAVAQLIGTNVIGNYSILTITDENYCFTDNPDPPSFDGPDITVIVVLSLIGLLVVCATAQEAWRNFNGIQFDPQSDGMAVNVLHCFSALNNGRKLLSMKVNPGGGTLNCLNGIRVLSTLWVVIGHTWTYISIYTHNANSVKEDGMSWWFQGIGNATVSVDTFFFMSGFLVCYLLLKELDRTKGKFNVGLFYLHRYLRLTPVYALVLGFIATLMVYVGKGPYWFQVVSASNACRIAWWKHFLYIQNLWPTLLDETCMGQTWYLAVDMQLFIIAPIFVYLLWRSPFAGLISLILTTIASITANLVVFSLVFLQPTIMFTRQAELVKVGTNNDYYYDVPWTRASPYLIGIYCGWVMKTTEGSSNRPIPKLLVVFNWIITIGVFGAIIFGLIPYLDETKVPEIPLGVTISYGALHRAAWATFIGGMVFACARGYGGVAFNRFLSWKGFIPLGRLTYCVYLIHLDYINVFFSWNRKQLYYTFMGTLTTYFGIVVTVFGLAFLVSVTIEASFLNLEKLLFKRGENRISNGVSIKAASP